MNGQRTRTMKVRVSAFTPGRPRVQALGLRAICTGQCCSLPWPRRRGVTPRLVCAAICRVVWRFEEGLPACLSHVKCLCVN